MATFYKVKDETGKVYTGVSEIDDIKSLKKKLHNGGWYVIKVAPFMEIRKTPAFRRGISLDTLIIFTHQLSSMLEVGIPMLKALEILWKQFDNPRLQIIISQLREKLSRGKSLSEAFSEFPEVFSPLYRAILSVAETGAGLVVILRKLVEHLNKQRMFILKVKRATTYPLIVVGFAILVVILMLMWVIPTFQVVFTKINVKLPLITQIILMVSALMRSVYFWILAGVVFLLAAISYRRFSSISGSRYVIDSLKLKLPLWGRILYITLVSRFVYSLSLLLSAGVSMSRSLEIAKETVINKRMCRSLDMVEKRITEGIPLSQALAETKMFPDLLNQMVAVGEESGTLSEMLERVTVHFEEELDYLLNKFVTILEPVIIIFVGVIVMFVLASLYLPIFKLWGEVTSIR